MLTIGNDMLLNRNRAYLSREDRKPLFADYPKREKQNVRLCMMAGRAIRLTKK